MKLTAIDLLGKKFSKLMVLERAENIGSQATWKCQCECGNIVRVRSADLRSGHTKSCGCLIIEKKLTHGHWGTRIYKTWDNIISRCCRLSCREYSRYGGRGIKVYKEWLDFQNFYDWAMANGYSDKLTIDRIDNDGDYCPENCRWVSFKEQQNNRSDNVYLTHNGITLTQKQWSEKTGLPESAIYGRRKRGWDVDKMLTTPLMRKVKVEV